MAVWGPVKGPVAAPAPEMAVATVFALALAEAAEASQWAVHGASVVVVEYSEESHISLAATSAEEEYFYLRLSNVMGTFTDVYPQFEVPCSSPSKDAKGN